MDTGKCRIKAQLEGGKAAFPAPGRFSEGFLMKIRPGKYRFLNRV
jgi:hypothetical protein